MIAASHAHARLLYAAWAILLLLIVAGQVLWIGAGWRQARGHEQELVAQNLVRGGGFSVEAEKRWLFPRPGASGLFPTAWVEPVYPLLMALAFSLLGEEGRLALLLLQALAWYLTALGVAYLIKTLFDPWVGVLAGTLMVLPPATRFEAIQTLGNPPLAGLMICASTILFFRLERRASISGALLLGVVLGFASQVYGAIAAFIPLFVALVLFSPHAPWRRKWAAAFSLSIAALAVLTRWSLRNYALFGEIVPFRNGFGFNAYLGNPVLVEAYEPAFSACPSGPRLSWQAPSPWETFKG